MELLYPTTPEMITASVYLVSSLERGLRSECGLGITQYRLLSCLRQRSPIRSHDVAEKLAVTPGLLTQALSPLIDEGFVLSDPVSSPRAGDLYITRAGKAKRHDADNVLARCCDEVLAGAGDEGRDIVERATVVLNQTHGPVRMKGERLYENYSVFEAFLEAERIYTKTSRDFGHSLSEVRAMYELYEYGNMPLGLLSQRLFLSKPAVNAALQRPVCAGHVGRMPMPGDRRTWKAALTDAGRSHLEGVIVEMDARSVDISVRAWLPGETRTYARITQQMVEELRSRPERH